ncbi:hypothetical protein [Streptomyces sp. CB00072]|uniref:hypothetical protein n=1 Tax=Streptomyces sp. CB00072 TaxID=1703928 RepID=UPI001F51CD8C|nr:hypothetical protein [Streptomyces sp. CB00072]
MQPPADVGDEDAVVDRAVRRLHVPDRVGRVGVPEVRRPAAHLLGQPLGEQPVQPLPVRGGVGRLQEQVQARAPFVVRRPGGVEAEHLGAGADPGGGVTQSGVLRVEHGPHGLLVEDPGQVESGQEHGIVQRHTVTLRGQDGASQPISRRVRPGGGPGPGDRRIAGARGTVARRESRPRPNDRAQPDR